MNSKIYQKLIKKWIKNWSKNESLLDPKNIQTWIPKTFKFGPQKHSNLGPLQSPKSSKNRPPDPFLSKTGFSVFRPKPMDLALNRFPKKFYPRFKPIRGKVFDFCNKAPDPPPWCLTPFLNIFQRNSHM